MQNVEYEDAGIYRCIVTYGQGDKTIDAKRETRAVQLFVSQPSRDQEYKASFSSSILSLRTHIHSQIPMPLTLVSSNNFHKLSPYFLPLPPKKVYFH